MLYWLTGTVGSSIRFYYEDAHAPTRRRADHRPDRRRDVRRRLPVDPPLRRARPHEHRPLDVYDRGSHFAAHDAPDLLVDDLREFFRPLR